jgi:Carbohydrate-binding family 9
MNSKQILIIIFLFTAAVISGQTSKSTNPADSILIVHKCNDFELTGKGFGDEWAKTDWITLSQTNSESPYNTRFKILYSDSGIYCLYECEDQKITATLKGDHLDLFNEDVIEAFFWADESIPVYFEYELSPLNYELILMVPNYKGNFLGWIPWHYEGNRVTRHVVSILSAGEKTEKWYGEFFIPFALMEPMVQKSPVKGNRWRANFYRIDYDMIPGSWSWTPIINNFHDYRLFGTLEFR